MVPRHVSVHTYLHPLRIYCSVITSAYIMLPAVTYHAIASHIDNLQTTPLAVCFRYFLKLFEYFGYKFRNLSVTALLHCAALPALGS